MTKNSSYIYLSARLHTSHIHNGIVISFLCVVNEFFLFLLIKSPILSLSCLSPSAHPLDLLPYQSLPHLCEYASYFMCYLWFQVTDTARFIDERGERTAGIHRFIRSAEVTVIPWEICFRPFWRSFEEQWTVWYFTLCLYICYIYFTMWYMYSLNKIYSNSC